MPAPIDLFATDLDGTLLGNPAATEHFNGLWRDVPAESRPLLIYNTGRMLDDVLARVEGGELLPPDYIVSGVGTDIFDVAAGRSIAAYQDYIGDGWDKAAVEALILQVMPHAELQPEAFQTPVKSSWYVDDSSGHEVDRLRRMIREAGLSARVEFSNNADLDLLPMAASKGEALAWLCRHLHIDGERVLVSGDRGNDTSMYQIADVRGILVDNAQPELFTATVGQPVYHSERSMAEGLIDGLVHFGVITAAGDSHAEPHVDQTMRLRDPSSIPDMDESDRDFLREAYGHACSALRRNITEQGFSAASLSDNDVIGTDVNYRSVWGRDGAITTIHTLCTQDPDIIACGKRTLDHLLKHTTRNGQVPANVRIETGEPDYSGVGGICAIDSALWLVIAVYHYVQHTGDDDLLQRYRGTLAAIMHWLESHDSNLDGLLEIPEASDWTDLFGRSYNVLYDEVLWYRANVCYGHLCERYGDYDEAARYLRHSQYIRGRLLHIFWPTTAAVDERLTSFADRQFSLGDARYLIAEVSPFNYSWRCDVFGNVLGFLFSVLDVPKARTALTFMWGCGVNEPWPVANLYPVVQAGDPDWRPYYTVNLLNLPHHYHNGGVWPLIGGMWVSFIDRLGQHDFARRELIRLARCCQQGRQHEWEFNEWYHGRTGRPMGMLFQAWSAATFISAYNELAIDGREEGSCSPSP